MTQGLDSVRQEDFLKALSPQVLKMLRVSQGFNIGFMVLWLVVICFAYAAGTTIGTPDVGWVALLTTLYPFVILFFVLRSRNKLRKLFSKEGLAEAASKNFVNKKGEVYASTPSEKSAALVVNGIMTEQSLLANAAFYGLFTTLVGSWSGALQYNPLYFINLLVPAIVLSQALRNFPTAERCTKAFDQWICKKQ